MSSLEVPTSFSSQGIVDFVSVVSEARSAVRAHVALVHEADGGFSAIVLNLPGCGSCGDNEDEAIAHVREAVKAVVESCHEDGVNVPWRDYTEYTDVPGGAKLIWIMVDV